MYSFTSPCLSNKGVFLVFFLKSEMVGLTWKYTATRTVVALSCKVIVVKLYHLKSLL